jgi:hypothetical protein
MELTKGVKITYRKDGLAIGSIVERINEDIVYLQCGNVINKGDVLKIWKE